MQITFHPLGVVSQARAGETLLQAANRAGIALEQACGGRGTCGKCRVVVEKGEVSPLTESERRLLSEEELAQGYRLACQVEALSDVEIRIPTASRVGTIRILTGGIANRFTLDPWAKKHHLVIPPATLEEQLADWDNLERVWRQTHQEPLCLTLGAARALPRALRVGDGNLSLIEVEGEIIRIEPHQAVPSLLGMAFDIGTTTIVGYLVDLESGRELAVASALNPQTRYGDDVVSRIRFADEHPDGLETLQREVVTALNGIIKTASARAHVDPKDIVAVTVAGNTTMQHLFLGISPSYLAQAPYVPVVTRAVSLYAREVGLETHAEAHVWVLPSIAGWVGGDTVAVLLATGLCEEEDLALAIDIGTNGEMALGSRRRVIACSTAAGPAFEGAHISCGMRAAEGAIDAVWVDHHLHWTTIGGAEPRGFCGSGLVDALAEFLRTGVIDRRGKVADPEALAQKGYPALAERVQGEGSHRIIRIVSPDAAVDGRAISLSQRDIRELQLAKGAIRAGIEILLKELGAHPEDVRKVFLAGAFGNYIRPQSALAIGLMPAFPHADILAVGNAAGSGAKMALLSQKAREAALEIRTRVEYLELSGRPDFSEVFAEAMLF